VVYLKTVAEGFLQRGVSLKLIAHPGKIPITTGHAFYTRFDKALAKSFADCPVYYDPVFAASPEHCMDVSAVLWLVDPAGEVWAEAKGP
jgi:hypothetical protein